MTRSGRRSSWATGFFFYDPNPGIEPLFLPYYYKEKDDGSKAAGCLEDSYQSLKEAAVSGLFDGMIRTSWDDAGLHNQEWMLTFLTAAAFSWNGHSPDLKEFTQTFFKNYYGQNAAGLDELFFLLNEGAYYYWDSFERKVWHFGEIGKTFLPDLPEGDALEYDPYWNTQNKKMVEYSAREIKNMDRALEIIKSNLQAGVKHECDLEVYKSIVQLIHHTCQTYLDFSQMEEAIRDAHNKTFVDRDSAYMSLDRARKIAEENLARRKQVYDDLVATWEKTRLPKGLSTSEKKYFFEQDRTRHFANRKADMSYLIYDEQQLDLEGYLQQLKEYVDKYRNNSF